MNARHEQKNTPTLGRRFAYVGANVGIRELLCPHGVVAKMPTLPTFEPILACTHARTHAREEGLDAPT